MSETWLCDVSPIDTFNIPNYSFLCKSRSSKRGGGVGIYVNKTYNYKEGTDLCIFDDGIFESIFVEIETNNFEKTLIGVIYRPPEYSNIDLFNEYIQTILHKLSKVQFSALHCLIYILMTFVMYQAFWNLRYLQMIQILFTVMIAQLHYVTLLILNWKS